jgi:tRNA(Ile)-lysidine synthase
LGVSAYNAALVRADKGKIVLDLGKLEQYDRSLRKKTLEEAFRRLSGQAENLPFDSLTRALKILDGHSGRKSLLAHGIYIENSQDQVAVSKFAKGQDNISLNIPGETEFPESNIYLTAEIIDKKNIGEFQNRNDIAHLDLNNMKDIMIRFWKKGDWIRPLGMKGKKLLSDIFIDRKIPEFERRGVPLVASGENIAWIAGVMISDEFKITNDTKKVLRIQLCAL